jgi:group I intron endonuclease
MDAKASPKSYTKIAATFGGGFIPPYNCEEVKSESGIYVIVNAINNHKYVGQSSDLLSRMKSHLRDLKYNRHANPYLQNAYNLHGRSSFVFLVLEYLPGVENLDLKEQYWIERIKPEYNIVHNVFENCMRKGRSKTDPLIISKGESFKRPEWHAWVYGGARNPLLNASRKDR